MKSFQTHRKRRDAEAAVSSVANEDEQVVVAFDEDSYIAYPDKTLFLDCHVESGTDSYPVGSSGERFDSNYE